MNLKQIAEMMQKEATKFGQAEEFLSGGLELAMRREGTTWRLTMRRRGERPSPKEQAIVRQYFGVPRHIKGEYDQSAGGYYLVRLAWTDADEKTAKAPKPTQPRLM